MLKLTCALLSLSPLSPATIAQTSGAAPIAVASPAVRAAIANRRAIFTLIGNNFRPVAEVLRSGGVAGQTDPQKYTRRVALLADFLPDAFPEISGSGETRAKADIWSNRADFDKLLRGFQQHAAQLAQADFTHDGAAFKRAAATVAQDCKSCHERYRSE
jgi:cytochrome c556